MKLNSIKMDTIVALASIAITKVAFSNDLNMPAVMACQIVTCIASIKWIASCVKGIYETKKLYEKVEK